MGSVSWHYYFVSTILSNPSDLSCTAAVGTAVGVSVSIASVVSFSMGVLVASVLGYISRRSKESSYQPSAHADPATVYDEVCTNKKIKGDAMEMDTNTAYGSQIYPAVYDEAGTNKRMGDTMEMNANTGSRAS